MSTHYETLSQADAYRDAFGVEPPAAGERHMTPRKSGFFVRSVASQPTAAEAAQATEAADPAAAPETAPAAQAGEAGAQTTEDNTPKAAAAVPERELITAQWGLVPHWVKSASDGRLRALKLVNARSETVSTAQAFRDAWLRGQRCIVPMAAFFEDDWRSGKAVPTRISRIDGKPMGVAGLWAQWTGPDGEIQLSYTLLTVNANTHALLHRYQQPGAEKRMPAVLNEGAYEAWLNARVEKAREFMRQYPSNWLAANPVENKADKRPKGLMG